MTSTTRSPRGPRISVRPATWADKDRVLAWRNEPATRAASLGTGVVDAAAHARWFADVLRRDDRVLLIAVERDRAVASVRFDAAPGPDRAPEPQCWSVSLMVDPDRRGEGLGRRVLDAGTAELRRRRGPVTIRAEVRLANESSRRLFAAAGFSTAAVDGGVATLLLRGDTSSSRPGHPRAAEASSRA